MVCVEMKAAGTREEGGNPGREILFLAALSAFKVAPFLLRIFSCLPHYHSIDFATKPLLFLLSYTRFQCESNKPMTSSFIDMLYKIGDQKSSK